MFMVGAIKRGLSLRDFEEMTLGMLLDYFFEFDQFENDEDEEIKATQEDFDKF